MYSDRFHQLGRTRKMARKTRTKGVGVDGVYEELIPGEINRLSMALAVCCCYSVTVTFA